MTSFVTELNLSTFSYNLKSSHAILGYSYNRRLLLYLITSETGKKMNRAFCSVVVFFLDVMIIHGSVLSFQAL